MIKVAEFFGGIGAPRFGLEDLGIKHEVVDYVEIDKFAVKSYNAMYDENYEVQDISRWDKDIEIDFLIHGSPCFTGDTLVDTSNGLIPMRDVKKGNMVKTIDGSYQRVLRTGSDGKKKIFKVTSSNSHGIECTENHPFYVLRDGKEEWVEVRNLRTTDYLISNINNKDEELKWEGVKSCGNNHSHFINKLPLDDDRFWYLVGRWIGDGWLRRRKERNNNYSGAIICCSHEELDELEKEIDGILNYTIVKSRTTYNLQFSNKELAHFLLKYFGKGAKNKFIHEEIKNLCKNKLNSLLNGYIDSDGHLNKNSMFKISSVSKVLIYDIAEIVTKVLNVPYSIYKTKRKSHCVIEGRVVNQNNTYTITFSKNNLNRIHFIKNGRLYSRVRKVEDTGITKTIYNLEVENNNTYCVFHNIVHNCQDMSVAGNQKGGDKDSGTRSSLMWETVRIIEKTRPKFILWENVKNVLSKKHIHNFKQYRYELTQMGYVSHYEVLNAKDYGIPQNRERVFCLSIRKDIYNGFEFPEKEELKIRLKDVLDTNVPENFYLKPEQYETLMKNLPKWNVNPSGKGMNGKVNTKDLADTITTNKGEGQKILEKIANKEISKTIRCGGGGSLDLKHEWDLANEPKRIGNIYGEDRGTGFAGNVWDKDAISSTLTTMQGGNRQPMIIDDTQGFDGVRVYPEYSPTLRAGRSGLKTIEPKILAQRGRYNEDGKIEQQFEPRKDDLTNTITTVQKDNMVMNDYRIRKLTPKECWRLMGFSDEMFKKAEKVNSNSQLYKQSGNSIVTNKLKAIYKQMIKYGYLEVE